MSVTKRIPIAIGIKPNAVTTFTNKTIDGTQNTLQNIPTSALQFNSISINGSTVPLGGSISIQSINSNLIPDYSGNPLTPSQLNFVDGHLSFEGDVVSGDIDYVTFTVGAQSVSQLYLTHYSSSDNIAFFAIQQGNQWLAGQDTSQMLAYGHIGPDAPQGFNVGDNILAPQGAVLQAGATYTMWIQQTGSNLTTYAFSTNLLYRASWSLTDTNTTYSIKATAVGGGANLDLDSGGSGVGTDSVKFEGGGNVTVSRVDANTIRISDAGTLGGVALTSTNTATLTNKTISGNNNTLSDIPNSALTNSSITINGNVVPLGGNITVAGGGGGAGDVTLTGIQTLTNKTISGSNNTITNLPNSSLINPFILINGTQVQLGQNFTVSGLGDVTLSGEQDLSNKSLVSPVISNPQIIGSIKLGSNAGGDTGSAGQILKSAGNGNSAEWINQSAITAGSVASALTIGSGLTSTGGSEYNGSNGVTISINTGVVATLSGAQTLSSKTLNNTTLTGSLTIGGTTGTAGQVLVSTGTGVAWSAGGSGSGSFNGPVTSTDNAIVRYDGTTGDTAQDSLVTISDTGVITAPSVASVIPFYHASSLAFPSASSANGAIAISASDNSAFYASNGNWIQLAKSADVSVSSRESFAITTSSLANNGTAYPNIENSYKSYLLFKIQTDKAAWVRVYTSTTTRSADSSRSIDVDPLPGSGVIAEVITSGASTQLLTPAVIGFNDSSPVSNTIYLAVTNRSGSTGTVTVTITALKLEA